MKDLLVFGIDFLLIMLLINIAINGMVIGDIEILSVTQIQEKNAKVTEAIEHSNMIQEQYISSKQSLNHAEEAVKVSAELYDKTKASSSEDVKKEANNQDVYDIEFLWAEVGQLATQNDLSLKITLEPTGVDNINTLKFKVMGQYRGITQFISEFDRSSKFQKFRIEDFNLFIYEQKPVTVFSRDGVTGKWLLQTIGATFTVKNVAIKKENLSKEFTGTTYEIEAGSEYQGFVKALDENVTNTNMVNGTSTTAANETAANTTNTSTATNTMNEASN